MKNKIFNLVALGIILLFLIAVGSYIYLRNNKGKLSEQLVRQAKEIVIGQINTDKKIITQLTVMGSDGMANERSIFKFDPITKQSQTLLSGSYEAQGVFQNHFIVKNTETQKFFEYNFATNSLSSLNFPLEKHWSKTHYQFVALSKNFVGEGKVLIVRYSYDNVDVTEGGGSVSGVPTEMFIYSFADNSYVSMQPLIQRGLKILGETKNYHFLGISSSGDKIFFDKMLGLAGCVNFAAVDIGEKSSWKFLKKETTVNQSSPISCPWISDLGTRIVYRSKKDDGTMLQLASTEDPNNPVKSIMLPTSLKMHLDNSKNTRSQERNASWVDDNSLLISFGHGMALADFNNETIKEIYFDVSVDESYTSWDFNNFGSDGGRYVALVDQDSSEPIPCPYANSVNTCPGKNGHSISRLLIVDILSGEKINIGDNLAFVGWIKL